MTQSIPDLPVASRGTSAVSPPVKLVVWDLDETLWRGTLSEGRVALIPGRAQLLNDLVDRGVMVSVCSKNDEDPARTELQRAGAWDMFVFPRINWEPKGPQLRTLIEAAQLRPENVLFVDDNHLNREEAAFFVPGIQVADPEDVTFDRWMERICASGKDDHARTRLAEYKVLEAKTRVAESFTDTTDFLRTCNILVDVTEHPVADVTRIQELIGRTNQLNYIKRRIDEEGVRRLLEDPETRSIVVRVSDRFGDYGLVGFAAVRGGAVEQLAFSCRILGMGVERAIYALVGRPAITVAEPVSAPLEGPAPDWLRIVVHDPSSPLPAEVPIAAAVPAGTPTARADILIVGGCDLEAAIGFMDRRRIATHMNYSPPDRPRLIMHRDSIDYLLADRLDAGARARILEDAPFLDSGAFDVPEWAGYDHIVYSPLIDYVQAKYVSDAVPGFYCSFGDMEQAEMTEERIAAWAQRYGLDAGRLRRFAASWHPVRKPQEVWEAQVEDLFARMSGARTVTVLLGATRTYDGLDERRIPTHRQANDMIRRVAERHTNVALVEVDPLLRGRADFINSIRHYSRRAYRDLAACIAERIGDVDVAGRPGVRANGSGPGAPLSRRAGQRAVSGMGRLLSGVSRRLGGSPPRS